MTPKTESATDFLACYQSLLGNASVDFSVWLLVPVSEEEASGFAGLDVPQVLRDAWEEYDDWIEAGRPCLGVPLVHHSSVPESAGSELDDIQGQSPKLGGNTSMSPNPSPTDPGTQGQGKGDALRTLKEGGDVVEVR